MQDSSHYTAIGLMSGTSLDGLDIACCIFEHSDNGKWDYDCIATDTVGYPKETLALLKKATELSGEELSILDKNLGEWYGQQTKGFIEKHNLKVDLIASHGHTIFHQPERKFTLQIGSGLAINLATKIRVINDFRSKDVALSGQGAPLVPIGDKLLFSDFDYCINLGGIANLSTDVDGKRIAYDIAPCNMVLNRLAGEINLKYDNLGENASEGKVIETLKAQLDEWLYYQKPYPKSLGYEHVSNDIFPLVDNQSFSTKDRLATFVAHLGYQIAQSISGKKNARALITGGGAYNNFLIEQIKANIDDQIDLVVPSKEVVEFKEAIIFAFLGVLRSRKEINCLSSVTGASSDSSSGVIFEL